jgi:hypothetical protein
VIEPHIDLLQADRLSLGSDMPGRATTCTSSTDDLGKGAVELMHPPTQTRPVTEPAVDESTGGYRWRDHAEAEIWADLAGGYIDSEEAITRLIEAGYVRHAAEQRADSWKLYLVAGELEAIDTDDESGELGGEL